jgi:hypothetical protein
MSRKFNFHYNLTRKTGILHENQCTFLNISRLILLGIKMFQTDVEKTKTHILYMVTFFSFENRVVCEIMWKNMVEPDRLQMTIQYNKTRALHTGYLGLQTHTKYITGIAFTRQQRLRERTSMLRHMYNACLIISLHL